MKQIYYIIMGSLITFLCFCCTSTDKGKSRQSMMEERLKLRKQEFISRKLFKCNQAILEEIETEVDLLMYDLLERKKGSNTEIPARPARPNRVVDTIILDANPFKKDTLK